VTAGARGAWVEHIAARMVERGQVKLHVAQAILAELRADGRAPPVG
jgi:hypothetical protein